MTECFRSIGKAFRRFWKDETGNQAVQMACLTPILLILIAFIFDRFIIYEGVTAVSYAGNEALRIAVIKPDEGAAKQSVLATLSDRLDATGMAGARPTMSRRAYRGATAPLFPGIPRTLPGTRASA